MAVLYEYALLVAALAILSALFEFMIPGGKLKQTVMLVVGLLFLVGIATPLVSLFSGGGFQMMGEQAISAPPAESGQLTHEELLQRYYEKYIAE